MPMAGFVGYPKSKPNEAAARRTAPAGGKAKKELSNLFKELGYGLEE